MTRLPVTETTLQAYADDCLSEAGRYEMEAFLATHPDHAERAAQYRRVNADLHSMFDPVLDEAIPDRFSRIFSGTAEATPPLARALRSGKRSRLREVIEFIFGASWPNGLLAPALPLGDWRPPAYAATLGWLSLGVALGWQMQRALPHNELPPMVKHAAVAYVTYASEVVHPVEIQASNEAHL